MQSVCLASSTPHNSHISATNTYNWQSDLVLSSGLPSSRPPIRARSPNLSVALGTPNDQLPPYTLFAQPIHWSIRSQVHLMRQTHAALTLRNSILLNTPFVGAYHQCNPPYPSSNTQFEQRYPSVALAIFGRFDVEQDCIWIAIREIKVSPTEKERMGRLTWTSLGWWPVMVKYFKQPGIQEIVLNRKFVVDGTGEVDAGKIKGAWLEKFGGNEDRNRDLGVIRRG